MNNIIVNGDDNKQLALYIGNKIGNFRTTYPMKRDYCGDINDELREQLLYDGIRTKRIYGLYKVNSFIGWLEEEDFTEEIENSKVSKCKKAKLDPKEIVKYLYRKIFLSFLKKAFYLLSFK